MKVVYPRYGILPKAIKKEETTDPKTAVKSSIE